MPLNSHVVYAPQHSLPGSVLPSESPQDVEATPAPRAVGTCLGHVPGIGIGDDALLLDQSKGDELKRSADLARLTKTVITWDDRPFFGTPLFGL